MKKLAMLLTPLLVLALLLAAVGCGDDEEETPAPTKTGVATPTATAEPTPTSQGYTGGKQTFKILHAWPATTYKHATVEYMDERLRYYTDGQVKLEIFPMGSLYSTFETWPALSTGALDMAYVGEFVPAMNGYLDYQMGYVAYYFGETIDDAPAHDMRFWEHPDGGQTLLDKLESSGVKGLGMVPGSHLQLIATGDKEMKSMWDIKGMKIATVGGLTGVTASAVDAIQVPVSTEEFSIAFQQGLVDIWAGEIDTAYSNQVQDMADYGLVVAGLISHMFVVMNLDMWDDLSPELKDIMENKVMPEVIAFGATAVAEADEKAEQNLIDEGVIIHHQSEEERLQMRDLAWEFMNDKNLLAGMNEDMIRLADYLRTEPYDTGYFFP